MLRLALQAENCFFFIAVEFDSLIRMRFAKMLMFVFDFISVSVYKRLLTIFNILNLHQIDFLFTEAHITFDVQIILIFFFFRFLGLKAAKTKKVQALQKNWISLIYIHLNVTSRTNHALILFLHFLDFKNSQTQKL
jgi:hypothetical protein